jgi:hypothetical protein
MAWFSTVLIGPNKFKLWERSVLFAVFNFFLRSIRELRKFSIQFFKTGLGSKVGSLGLNPFSQHLIIFSDFLSESPGCLA